MGRYLTTILLALLLIKSALSQSYGLAFNSHETLPEKRTALELTPDDSLCFSGKLRINFDMNFISGNQTYFGYILRILNHGENIDFIYDQRARLFRITEGKTFSGLSFSLDSAHLFYQWNEISIFIDPSVRKMELRVNGKRVGFSGISLPGGCYKFLWGANDYSAYQTRDIPSMRIREVRLFDNDDLKYHWPLNNITGTISLDEVHQKQALVKNAVWLRPGHRNWELQSSFVLNGNALTAFDSKRERLFVAGSDSVLVCDMRNLQNPWIRSGTGYENILRGSQGVYDTITGRLYDVFIDQKKVAAYGAGDPRWDVSFDSALTEYWHPNKFISSLDTALYTIGGYGQLRYKNIVQRYRLTDKTWEVVKTKGDFFPPRYLSALGINQSGDTAYIIGGYGSPAGDQMLNPTHYSDFFAFDIPSGTFRKLFDFDSAHSKFTFANSLVIDSKNQSYYGLVFPNDSFNSNLRLIRGSLREPGFQFLGDEIPFSFYDLRSFADLYYSPKAGKLIAVTFYCTNADGKKGSTAIKIYTIDFPPEYLGPSIRPVPVPKPMVYIVVGILAALLTGGLVLYRRKRREKEVTATELVTPAGESGNGTAILPAPIYKILEEEEEEETAAPARIFLFGQFQVFDKEGVDITNLFTPVLRELFLLILIYTARTGRGISAEELTEILWIEKPVKDAKNNRSVNMAKLKTILERIGESLLVKQSGFWQFQILDQPIHVDYLKYLELVTGNFEGGQGHLSGTGPGPLSETGQDHLTDLLKIVKKGAFLIQTEYNWLDDIKVEISNEVIERCLKFMRDPEIGVSHPEFIIELANCIFQFDPLNEYALEYKCKSLIVLKRLALAGKTYDRFIKDYREIYGEEFGRSFHDIISATSTDTLHH